MTNQSDIDYIVVVNTSLTVVEKKRIMSELVELSKSAPEKGIEMSVVVNKDVNPFQYPTPFELHSGKEHFQKFMREREYMCADGRDYDLAAHIFVLHTCGICLYGPPISEVFEKIPREYYIDSILKDIVDAPTCSHINPVYYLLNLSRVWRYLEEDVVSSKLDGGKWALEHIGDPHKTIIKNAIASYQNKKPFLYHEGVNTTVKLLLEKINKH
jgi:streptomycin 3"-adenylyltransferase